jgi:hypothetical protein
VACHRFDRGNPGDRLAYCQVRCRMLFSIIMYNYCRFGINFISIE